MQGSIQKRVGKRGVTWTVVVDMPPDPATGKRRQKRISAPTKHEVERLVAQHIATVESGGFADAGRVTLGEYLTRWLESIEETVRPQTRRRYADLSLLLIAGANRIEDRIAGLRAGADDCVGRPFAAEEIAARIDVLLRRDGMRRIGAAVLRHGSVVLDRATRQAYPGDARLELTRTECDLLELFLLYPGEALRRSFIYERVWDSDARYHSNSLEVYVSSLRRKLEKHGHSRLIHTLRGVGYVLRGEPG